MKYEGKLYGKVSGHYLLLNETTEDLDNAKEAIDIIDSYNTQGNDLKAYLHQVAEWGLGNVKDRPKPIYFGLVD